MADTRKDRPHVYIETSVISYLTARLSGRLVIAAHQQLTQEWWEERERFELFVSEAVLQEAGQGDSLAARSRLAALEGIPVLEITPPVTDLARGLIAAGALPAKALVDSLHIAVAAVNGMDYLLTWNCSHIANALMRGTIERSCRDAGCAPPVICTPEELQEREP